MKEESNLAKKRDWLNELFNKWSSPVMSQEKKKQFGKGSNPRPERRDKKERQKKCYKMKGTKIKANRNENENGADMRQE